MSTPSKPSRGRSNRSRNGGRNNQNTRQDKPPPSTLPKKSTPAVSTDKPKTSRLSSRANSTTHSSQSSPVVESPASPASSRSSNRRRRSGAGKGNNIPKINPPLPDDNLLHPERSRFGGVPHSAPIKDRPPHFAKKPPLTPSGSANMNKDIDALVERVRAVAMAEHRPSTPGSHIDWAGDDDDSLPDLNDWGIPSLPDPAAHTISPIIVDGLTPLPELSSGLTAPMDKPDKDISPLATAQEVQHSPQTADNHDIQKPAIHHSLPPKPQTTSDLHIASEIHEPMAPRPVPSLAKRGGVSESIHRPTLDKTTRETGSRDLAESAHAPAIEEKPRLERDGLAASIHAPQNTTDSCPVPGSRFPRNQPPRHNRTQTVGRPFPRVNQNDTISSRSPRGGSPKHHTRNYSSPATANRHSHSRPVLTGDALSRLVKAVGSTTMPSAKPTSLT